MTNTQTRLQALRERTVAAALQTATAGAQRSATRYTPTSRNRRTALALWLLAAALVTAPYWAPSSQERDQRFDRGAAATGRELTVFALHNLKG